MAYNFKSIADVETVTIPTDNTNVLVEEDGVIKKIDRRLVNSWDMIIEVSPTQIHASDLQISDFSVISGHVPDIIYKCQNLLPVNILFKWHWDYGDLFTTFNNSIATSVAARVYPDTKEISIGAVLGGSYNSSLEHIVLHINENNEIFEFSHE